MFFEYDPKKASTNKEKHNISFEEAKTLWECDHIIINANTTQEPRSIIIGTIKNKLHTCIFTTRDAKIRLISCRRSRKNEEDLFHETIKK